MSGRGMREAGRERSGRRTNVEEGCENGRIEEGKEVGKGKEQNIFGH